jgi:hypothetical protein
MIKTDELEKMAKQTAAFGVHPSGEYIYSFYTEHLQAFAKLVAQHEREACAQILANTDLSGLRDHPLQNWVAGLLFEFIKAIRAKGDNK